MASASDSFLFCQIPSKDAVEAFDFHLKFTDNEYIWPRTTEQIESYAQNGELFAVRSSSREIVGICYVTLDGNRWELGGLGVSDDYRKYGLGSVLTRFALSRSIAASRPWTYDQTVIAHVHELNPAPRNVLKAAGFEQNGQETPPQDRVPPSMKRNAAGLVVGDVFVFPKAAVGQLIKLIKKDFSDPLRDGKSTAVFDENEIWNLQTLLDSLEEAAA